MDSVNTWRADLSKPPFNPPGWAFGVVWPILYVMMGVAAFLIGKKGIRRKPIKLALGLFVLQLVGNRHPMDRHIRLCIGSGSVIRMATQ